MPITVPEGVKFDAVNKTVMIEGEGRLAGRKVMLFCAPLSKGQRQMEGDIPQGDYNQLRKSYQALFNAAQAEGKRSIAIPCFSTGKGALDRAQTAKIAVEEAVNFTKGKDFRVDFVPYDDDTANVDVYTQEIYARIQGNETDLEHVTMHPGDIVDADDDVIVCPLRENYDFGSSGPTAGTINRAFDQDNVAHDFRDGLDKGMGLKLGQIQEGDIVKSNAEYIVSLPGETRVINKANPLLVKLELEKKRGEGDTIVTTAENLAKTNGTKGIIHASGDNPYYNALFKAHELGAKSVALSYVKGEGTQMLKAVDEFCLKYPDSKTVFRIVCKQGEKALFMGDVEKYYRNPLIPDDNAKTKVVDSHPPLKCKKVLFTMSPTKEDLENKVGFFEILTDYHEKLDEYYKTIFETALEEGATTVAFSPLGRYCYDIDDEKALEAAWKAAVKYTSLHPELYVRIVIHHKDEISVNALTKLFDPSASHVDVVPGFLEHQDADMVVVAKNGLGYEAADFPSQAVLDAVRDKKVPEDPKKATFREENKSQTKAPFRQAGKSTEGSAVDFHNEL